jgi:hypothetical protein
VLNAALALHFVGMKNNADDLTKIGIKLLMEGVFSDELSIREFNEIAQKAISDAQREKAKDPVIHIIQRLLKLLNLHGENILVVQKQRYLMPWLLIIMAR